MFETIVALVTPFTKDNLIDFESLIKIIDHLEVNGIDGVVVLGSTGECSSINDNERLLLYNFICKYVNNRMKVILGVGSNDIEKTIKYIKMAENTKCDSLLVVTPYYVCPDQRGLEIYFDKVLSSTNKECILYNVKKRCGCEINSETIYKLICKHDNLIGLKQACGNYEEYLNIKEKFIEFKIYSGDDNMIFDALNLGLNGVISVIGNAYPLQTSELKYSNDSFWLNEICSKIYKYPSPTGIKAVMENMGLCNGLVRLPLANLSEQEKQSILI